MPGHPSQTSTCSINHVRDSKMNVFKMNVFNVFDVNSTNYASNMIYWSIRFRDSFGTINKKCHQKCRAAMAKHPHARIRVLPFC